jgi:hypothetical protein
LSRNSVFWEEIWEEIWKRERERERGDHVFGGRAGNVNGIPIFFPTFLFVFVFVFVFTLLALEALEVDTASLTPTLTLTPTAGMMPAAMTAHVYAVEATAFAVSVALYGVDARSL